MKFSFLLLSLFIFFNLTASQFEAKMLREESEKSGQIILQRVIDVIGDYNNINNVKTTSEVTKFVEIGEITFQSEVFAVFPDKIQLKYEDKEFIINNNNGWIKYPKGYYENLSKKMTQILKSNLEKNLINFIKNRDDFYFYFDQIVTEDDQQFEVLHIINKHDELYNSDFLLYIDTKSYLPKKLIYSGSGKSIEESDLILEKSFLEYREIEGYKYPSKTITKTEKGVTITKNELLEIEVNLSYDKNLFK